MDFHVLLGLLLLAFIARIDANAPVRGSTVLESDFSSWLMGSVLQATGISAMRSLRDIVGGGDDERAGGNLLSSIPLLEKVKAALTTYNISHKKLGKWLDKGKSADIAFVRMSLTPVKEGLFHSPRLAKWLYYVDELNARTPGKGTPAISTLIKHYGNAKLFDMIKFAKQSANAETEALAVRLQSEQLQRWLAAVKKPDETFHIMKLNVRWYK
ncbi:hypothetical protein PHYSODRAFT_286646 [Phytophthora sojae]|uniref:RxLR effector protein n=2 Tax=Phytophthora sojae TaxID=67593 RepID=G4ZUZ7_PHYSP|nr:hypothetical protein PHYSODRAFT_286646 [Phytophthora sojae]AEK81291.1 Avh381 [Phytophthora sojae]AEK81292.1 Avh381 [Phytophthora sojae]AEK81293.1 Avh381 [Phytophthora sojae]EGZ13621.1 hypothetical protein PHYSODRAFT_286646 [Phytophthora sojae]|eukprot:XP_009531050.1 hypothetical protein PHYSODRAFT_286646 [Phytophthora sojae]